MDSRLPKSQIDRLGERLKAGKITEDDIRLLDEYRRSFGSAYEIVVETVRESLNLKPTGRPAKSTRSVIEKLQRETVRLTQIQDIAGCRIVLPDLNNQNKIVELLIGFFPQAKIFDRREKPNSGYRAVHVVPNIEDKPIEIQIRTALQHRWAELSEKLADVIDPAIKYGGGTQLVRDLLATASNTISQVEAVERIRISLNAPERTSKEIGDIMSTVRYVLENGLNMIVADFLKKSSI